MSEGGCWKVLEPTLSPKSDQMDKHCNDQKSAEKISTPSRNKDWNNLFKGRQADR